MKDKMITHDVVVIGGGPAGLATSINLAAEGYKTAVVDSKITLGGQASRSYRIENYPGFPGGISGEKLIDLFIQQASRFGVEFLNPAVVNDLKTIDDGLIEISTTHSYHSTLTAKAVVIASGLSYRTLSAPGINEFLGRGVSYGSVSPEDKNVCIVGGANSAGQAALHLSGKGVSVTMIVRESSLEAGMSQYLTSRINQSDIKVLLKSEVMEVFGTNKISHIRTKTEEIATDALAIYIGASPKTFWLKGLVDMTDKGYVKSGYPDKSCFETSMKNVFVCGDVRDGSAKRVAVSVGEGSTVAQQIHSILRCI